MVPIKIDTHTVIKNDDANKYLSKRQKRQLKNICRKISLGRIADGKKVNSYIICNTDEPYANDVYTRILFEEEKKGDGYFLTWEEAEAKLKERESLGL